MDLTCPASLSLRLRERSGYYSVCRRFALILAVFRRELERYQHLTDDPVCPQLHPVYIYPIRKKQPKWQQLSTGADCAYLSVTKHQQLNTIDSHERGLPISYSFLEAGTIFRSNQARL